MRSQADRNATIVTGTDATICSMIPVAYRLALTLFALTLARPTAGQSTNSADDVRTVIYGAADRPAERWRLATTPSLVIGTVAGASETQVYNIVRVLRPPRFRLMDAGSDYVAGVSRDANDVERVVVYRLLRDAPAGAGSTFD